MSDHGGNTPKLNIVCGDLKFTLGGWWHDAPGFCNHFKNDKTCTHTGGKWRPVYILMESDSGRSQGGSDGV